MTAIKQTVTIQPGGRIEVVSEELPEGRQAEVIILVDEVRPTRHFTDFIAAGQGLYPDIQAADRTIREERDASDLLHEEPLQEYPLADFVKQTEYAWDEDFFAAEEAVRRYLKESHADH